MSRRILLVEGTDDLHVISALLKSHQMPPSFTVEVGGGIERLLQSMPVRLKESDLERLGLVVDADEKVEPRWQEIRRILLASGGQGVPDRPHVDGTIVQIEDGPAVGVWLMPDNVVPGELETFLSFLVPHEDILLPRVDAFLHDLPDDARRFREQARSKARIHAWLALQREPGKPLGQAITARYLDAHLPAVQPFLSWMRKLLAD